MCFFFFCWDLSPEIPDPIRPRPNLGVARSPPDLALRDPIRGGVEMNGYGCDALVRVGSGCDADNLDVGVGGEGSGHYAGLSALWMLYFCWLGIRVSFAGNIMYD